LIVPGRACDAGVAAACWRRGVRDLKQCDVMPVQFQTWTLPSSARDPSDGARDRRAWLPIDPDALRAT
jgi:hypothetical protein